MNLLLLPIHVLRLSYHLLSFSFTFVFHLIYPYRATLLVTLFLSLYIALFIKFNKEKILQFIPLVENKTTTPPLLQEIGPNSPISLDYSRLTETELNELHQANQALLELQPHHRDLLINQALVEYYLGNTQGYELLVNQAQTLDPNYPLFE